MSSKWALVSKIFRIKICVNAFRIFVCSFLIYSSIQIKLVYSYQIRYSCYIRLFVSNSFIRIKIRLFVLNSFARNSISYSRLRYSCSYQILLFASNSFIRIKFVYSFIHIKLFVYSYKIFRLFISKYPFIRFSCPIRSGFNCRCWRLQYADYVTIVSSSFAFVDIRVTYWYFHICNLVINMVFLS